MNGPDMASLFQRGFQGGMKSKLRRQSEPSQWSVWKNPLDRPKGIQQCRDSSIALDLQGELLLRCKRCLPAGDIKDESYDGSILFPDGMVSL